MTNKELVGLNLEILELRHKIERMNNRIDDAKLAIKTGLYACVGIVVALVAISVTVAVGN